MVLEVKSRAIVFSIDYKAALLYIIMVVYSVKMIRFVAKKNQPSGF
jgi:hypothetical protein